MSEPSLTHYCISCGEIFHPANPDIFLCPACGGPAEAPPGLPTFVDDLPLEPAGAGTLLDTPSSISELSAQVSLPGFEEPINISNGHAGETTPDSSPAEEEEAWPPGTLLLDTYEVKGVLGAGGMGKVYRVHHNSWNIDLALKSPRPEFFQTQAHKDLFISEAETWINLGLHPHIVSCYYVRTIDEIPRLFAECVEGGSLAGWIARRRIQSLEQVLDIAIQFAWGLAYAHEQGLVHRDVKPANVLMAHSEGDASSGLFPAGIAKVTDFGLAKAKKGLTPVYCSPEQADAQFDDQIQLTPASDLWSWALSLLEMIAGSTYWADPANPSFAWGVLAPQALQRYLEGKVENPRLVGIPPALAELLGQCFQREPEKRPGGMGEVVERLQEIYQAETGQPYRRQFPKAAELRADSLNNKALSLLDLSKEVEAMHAWDEALQADPAHLEANYNHSLLLWRKVKITDQALVDRITERCPAGNHPWNKNYLLALVNLERDDCQEAERLLAELPAQDQARQEIQALYPQVQSRLPDSRRLLSTIPPTGRFRGRLDLSLDGHWLVAGEDRKAIIWDLNTGECHRTSEVDCEIKVVKISRNGQKIFLGLGSEIQVWDVTRKDTSQMLNGHIEGHSDDIRSFGLDRNLTLCGVADEEGAKIWEVTVGLLDSANLAHRLKFEEGHCNHISISADGKLVGLATASSVHFYQPEKRKYLRGISLSMAYRDPNVRVIGYFDLSQDGKAALFNNSLWDVRERTQLASFYGHIGSIYDARLSYDNSLVVTGGEDGTMRCWEATTGRCLRTFKNQSYPIVAVRLDEKASLAVSLDQNDAIMTWKVSPSQPAYLAPFVPARIRSSEVALSTAQKFESTLQRAQQALEVQDYQGAISGIDHARELPGHEADKQALDLLRMLYQFLPKKTLKNAWPIVLEEKHGARTACISHKGDFALIGSRQRIIRKIEIPSGKELAQNSGALANANLSSSDSPLSIRIDHADCNFIAASGGRDGAAKVLSCHRLTLVDGFRIGGDRVSVDFAPNGQFVVVGASTNTYINENYDTLMVYLYQKWNRRSASRWMKQDYMRTRALQISADGRYVLASNQQDLVWWDLRREEAMLTLKGHGDRVTSLCLAKDGRTAYSGSYDKTIRTWDMKSGECIRVIQENEEVKSLCLADDGKFLFSAGDDTVIKVWETVKGNCVGRLEGHKQPVTSLSMSSDSSYLLSGDSGGTVIAWSLDWQLEVPEPTDWDDAAAPLLLNFLSLHVPYTGKLPPRRQPTSEEFNQAILPQGQPEWQEESFQGLLQILGRAGFWLRPESVRRELEKMARERI